MIMLINYTSTTKELISDKGIRRKLYRKPKLDILGDIRTLTLGGSPGGGDSGGGLYTQLPPGVHRSIPPGFPQPDGFPRPGDPNWPPPQP
jgi:hypothetical protein